MREIIYITGTDTDVGKTMATAALAATLAARGASVAVYKPTQTGVPPGGHGDMDEVARLAGVAVVREGVRLRHPMAPVAAALREHRRLPSLAEHVDHISELAAVHSHVLIEGAGGLLVELDGQWHTVADLAGATREVARTAVVVVCRSGLGTLNHTELTVEALQSRGLPVPALVIGSWPSAPSEIELSNRDHLHALDAAFLGSLPEGASKLDPHDFRRLAPHWLALPGWA
ncbi:dethiobiotin synthase [Arthrobacter alpinus]|uniref:ATP-dependent dethiobiotin synthetase BioD n=1 Tax=Arthrobacter alpinus TaxID=656366 RepID=A0A0M5LXL7_9MICC|nr:dethiobiotin synthase [Arthrobacter alpinus]ALE92862.1 dethiobiotin synthase [Arthrobacter alpinus]